MQNQSFIAIEDFNIQVKSFRENLINQEIQQSMSRVGHCIDNGPTEGFWGIIKTEMYAMYEIIDEDSLRFAIILSFFSKILF